LLKSAIFLADPPLGFLQHLLGLCADLISYPFAVAPFTAHHVQVDHAACASPLCKDQLNAMLHGL